jgi:hypothetical protein
MNNWSVSRDKGPEWPLDGTGERIRPVFLERKCGSRFDLDMELGLLSAYGIPTVCTYPNDGEFSELVIGYPVSGAEIYVPETLLDDARNIISADLTEYDPDKEGGDV